MSGVQGAARLGALALVFNAFTWGVSWWPLRALQDQGLHPLWATVLVYLLAVLVLTSARPRAWRELLHTPALWLLVLASGTTNAAFNWAVTVGDVVRVVLLFYLMPLWTVLLARWLLAEPITAHALLRVALALVGAAIVLWPDASSAPKPANLLADALGVLGGAAFALNNVMLRRQAASSPAARGLAMFAGGVLVAGVLALGLAAQGQVAPPPAPAAPWLLGVAALGAWFLASNLALQYGAARLRANTTAVVMVTEVFFASASAVALGAAALGLGLVLGGTLIVAAALLAALEP